MSNRKIYRALLNLINDGLTVIFIGSGFSLIDYNNSSISRDRKGLKEHLIEQYKETLQEINHKLDKITMEDIASYLLFRQKESKDTICCSIREFLLSSDELVKLESFILLHKLISLRPDLFEVIITTNWDKGIENSLESVPEIEINPINKDKECLNYDSAKLNILKIHGDIDDSESIILSSDDFDFYEKKHPRFVDRLRVLFSTKHFILLGYSARDENFKRIYGSICYELGDKMRSGYLIAPEIPFHEELWIEKVKIKHIPCTAQEFLTETLIHVAQVPIGISNKNKKLDSKNSTYFHIDTELSSLALKVRKKYGMREVWVARHRRLDKPNEEIGQAASLYIENRCRKIKSIAISTGKTVEAMANTIDNSKFLNRLIVMPTIVLHIGRHAFKAPSHVAQTFVSRFTPGLAECVSLQLPSEELISILFSKKTKHYNQIYQTIKAIAKAHVKKAVSSDVIVSSVRPPHWFGSERIPLERTMPIQYLPIIDKKKFEAEMKKLKVVGIHQMIMLDKNGNDLMDKAPLESQVLKTKKVVCRPSVDQLRKAAASKRQRVITVASHKEKLQSVKSIIYGKLCNVLIIDEVIAKNLVNSKL